MGWIVNPITTALLKLVWTIVIKGPIQLIAAFNKVFQYLTAGIFFDAIFGGKKFNINKLPLAFWAFLLLAAFVIVLIFVIQFFTLMYQEDSTIKKRLLKAASNTFRAGLLTVVMPVAFFVGIDLIQFAQVAISKAFGQDDNALARMLYYVGNTHLDPTKPLPAAPGGYGPPDNIRDWNWIAEIVGVYVTAWALCLAGLACAGKVFEMYTLFIIGPLFAASMVADDGVRLKIWRDSVIAKMFVSAGTILTYSIYVSLLPMLFQYANSTSNSFNILERILFEVLVLIGGGVFLETMPPFFANFVGEAAGKAEGKHALGVAKAGTSLAKAGLFGMALAAGVGKIARNKQASKLGNFASAAANAGQKGPLHKNMVGVPGMIGKGIRLGSSLIGGGILAGRSLGLHGKNSAKTQWAKNKTYAKNIFAKRKSEFMDNWNHHKRHESREKFRRKYDAHKFAKAEWQRENQPMSKKDRREAYLLSEYKRKNSYEALKKQREYPNHQGNNE